MADELNVIVVQVQTTGDWDVSCFNPICGEGIHGVGESPSKGKADAMARRHRLELSREIARQGEPTAIVNWQTRAEKAEAALAEATERSQTRDHLADREHELARLRLAHLEKEVVLYADTNRLIEAKLVEQREVIDDQRRVNGEAIHRAEQAEASIDRVRTLHRIHWCEVDGHKLDRTPNPCVNNGICRCGQRDQCPTLAALATPKEEPRDSL